MTTTHVHPSIDRRLADELGVRSGQVTAAVALLDGGATVPFIARYRKEATEMLDDAQLRTLEDRLGEKLLAKSGRTLVPTEIGRLVFSYADEIFALLVRPLAERSV